ncbi:MAG: FecR domain-containing protein [Xanthobacteraceae bacterium]
MSGKFIVVPLAAALIAAGPALAQQVGTATAVNAVSESTPPGGATDKLAVGARVMHNERIHTSSSGSAQLLFLDKSSLSIAPNTSLVIDEFVYDPAANRGHMLTRLTQGTLQYIGGQLSHQGAVTINTPAVAVGIRGGTVTITHGANGTQITNQYGTITPTNAAGTTIVTQPDYTVTVANRNTPPGQPMRVTADEVRRNIKKLSSQFGQDGGVRGLKRIDTARLSCATHARSACPELTWPSAAENDAAQIIMQSTQRATVPTPPRVIRGD